MSDPTVPLTARMPHGTQTVLIVAMAVLASASITYAVLESRRRRDLVLVYLVIGAGLAVYYEPLGDALVRVFYTERGQDTWITAFGRQIPVFIGLLYFWYMPIGAYVLLRSTARGISARGWWARWAGYATFAVVFEMAILTVGGTPWIYHGTQAFMLLHVPVLTPFTYISFVTAIAAGVTLMARHLPRSQQWLIVPAVPVLMLAGHAATSLPLAIVLYSNTHSTGLVALGAIGSAGLAIALSYVASQAFVERKPEPVDAPAGARTRPAPPVTAGV